MNISRFYFPTLFSLACCIMLSLAFALPNQDNSSFQIVEFNPVQEDSFVIVLTIRDPNDAGIQNVQVVKLSPENPSVEITDSNGVVIFREPKSAEVVFYFDKSENHKNGISVTDIVLAKKHVIGAKLFTEEWQKRAADVNRSGSISAIDLIQIQKLLLGISATLPNRNWEVIPMSLDVSNPGGADTLRYELLGFKVGDVNASADPRQ